MQENILQDRCSDTSLATDLWKKHNPSQCWKCCLGWVSVFQGGWKLLYLMFKYSKMPCHFVTVTKVGCDFYGKHFGIYNYLYLVSTKWYSNTNNTCVYVFSPWRWWNNLGQAWLELSLGIMSDLNVFISQSSMVTTPQEMVSYPSGDTLLVVNWLKKIPH